MPFSQTPPRGTSSRFRKLIQNLSSKGNQLSFSQLRILLLIFKRLAKVALLVLVLPHSNAGEESGDHSNPFKSPKAV